MNPIKYRLANGLRIIHVPSPTHVVYCGFCINAGTRDELPQEQGLAHFTEHMSFKGTEKRRAWQILNRMESVGGDLNAYTTKEETVYYTACLDRDFERAADLLSDLVFNSTFPQSEIDRELGVVLDEIQSYEDSPSELIFDDFEGILFKGDQLAGNILGEPRLLETFRTETFTAFTHRYYNPDNMVFFVFGNIPEKKVLSVAQKYMEGVRNHDGAIQVVRKELPPYSPQHVKIDKETHQAHVMIGTRGLSGSHKDRMALYMLNNILGGPGMNSRLNLTLREKRGLVYNVESNSTSYTDTGIFSIYFGCDPEDIEKCISLAMAELRKISREILTPNRLRAARNQLMGQMAVSSDNFENVALGMGKTFLHYNDYQTREELFARISSITSEQLQSTAEQIFMQDRLSTLIYI